MLIGLLLVGGVDVFVDVLCVECVCYWICVNWLVEVLLVCYYGCGVMYVLLVVL